MKIEDLEKVNILTQYINGIDDFIDKYNFNPKHFTIESGHFAIDIIKEQGHEIKNALEKIKSNLIEQLKELGVEVDNTASSTKKKEYPKIIDLSGKCGYDSQIWILEEKESTETKLQYYGYDACVFPLPKLSKTSKENQKRVLGNMGNKLKDVNMEIWLDDIRLKSIKENNNE